MAGEATAGEDCLGSGEAVGSAFATPTTPADSDINSAAARLAARGDRIDHNLSGRGHENATPGSSHFFDLVSALSPRARGGRVFRRDMTMMLQHP